MKHAFILLGFSLTLVCLNATVYASYPACTPESCSSDSHGSFKDQDDQTDTYAIPLDTSEEEEEEELKALEKYKKK